MKRFKAVTVKELTHILRDPVSLTIVFLMPAMMMVIFSYAINFDLNEVRMGYINRCKSELSRELISTFANNRYYSLTDLEQSGSFPIRQGESLLKAGKIRAYMIIPADFQKKMLQKNEVQLGVVIDGSDSNVASLVYQYNEMIINRFIQKTGRGRSLLSIKNKVYFNPELKSNYFFVPGIVAILLVMVSALLTSLSIAREKESGSIDLLYISPLKSAEIIFGKTLPYIGVALIEEVIILMFARFWFNIPLRGSLVVLFVFSFLYITASLSLGILVSTLATSQKSAMFAALLITLLPSIMLSGFIFPLDSMGPVLRGISYLVPASYFLRIIRGIILKGSGLAYFLFEGGMLAVFALVLLFVASMRFNRFRKRIR